MRRSFVAFATTAALAGGGVLTGQTAAFADADAAVSGSHPLWAVPGNRAADVDTAAKVTFRVYLNLRNRADAEATAKAVSDPADPRFRKYLNNEQLRQKYLPGADAVAAVRSWLGEEGFAVGQVPTNNMYVESTGTTAQAERAFAVDLGLYRVADATLRAPDRELRVPAALGDVVAGVVGLDQSQNLLKPQHTTGDDAPAAPAPAPRSGRSAQAVPSVVPPPKGYINGRPCGDYYGHLVDTLDPAYGGGFTDPLPYAPCGYKPGQLRKAYGLDKLVSAGLDGRGQTVAVIGAFGSPTLYEDAAEYARRNDPAHPLRREQFSQIIFPANTELEGPDRCNAVSWYGEATLDVEAVHAMAPGANILYVGASDCLDAALDQALNEVVANDRAQIITNSWGNITEVVSLDAVDAFEAVALQAALKGIGMYVASGDKVGGDVPTTPQPQFPATSTWVTAVGGTSLGIGKDGRRVVETGWQTGRSTLTDGAWTPQAPGEWIYGGRTGSSRLHRQPWYQKGIVPDAMAKQNQADEKDRGRVTPDISMVGDPNTGMLTGVTQTFPDGVRYSEYRLGGTSLSSPLLAGVMALADQATNTRHGFINPWLYKVTSRTPAIRDIKHEVGAVVRVDYVNTLDDTAGVRTSVRTFDWQGGGPLLQTTRGYDVVTGLGVPNGLLFLLLS